jgi:alpha-1,3-rhamnosyl/mannosyltransferase
MWTRVPFLRRFMHRAGCLESTREKRIRRILGDPDVIHLSGVQPFGRGRVKVVTFYDDTPWTAPGSHTETTLRFARRLEALIRGGASVLAISGWSARRAAGLFGVAPERIAVAGGAADGRFSPGEPDPGVMLALGLQPRGYLLHVGSFVPRKNIPFLAECFRSARIPGQRLVLAGAEEWGAEASEYAAEVTVVKRADEKTLLSLYRGARAVLVPSSEEGLGLTVLEALACGVPVAVSDGGALPETLDGAGLVLPVLDREAWTMAIRALAADGPWAGLRERAEKHPRPTWEQVAGRALDFYRERLERSGT